MRLHDLNLNPRAVILMSLKLSMQGGNILQLQVKENYALVGTSSTLHVDVTWLPFDDDILLYTPY